MMIEVSSKIVLYGLLVRFHQKPFVECLAENLMVIIYESPDSDQHFKKPEHSAATEQQISEGMLGFSDCLI